jgi:uncharacterized membrane protein YccC
MVSAAPVSPPPPHPVELALRVAFAATACLHLTELLDLPLKALSVYSVHMIMTQYTFTAFQKGVERLLGRGGGVAYGLLLVLLFSNLPILFVLCLTLGLLAIFYLFASNRLAYANLNGGLFMAYMAVAGLTAPQNALDLAVAIFAQLLLGFFVVVVVNWASGAERSMTVVTHGEALWPIRLDWLGRAAEITTTQLLALLLGVIFDLPLIPTSISASMIAVVPDAPARHRKGLERVLGVFLGGGYAIASLLLLTLQPHWPLFLLLVFTGMFLASYWTRISTKHSYVFLQMGLVLAMVMIGSQPTLGNPNEAVQRLVGVIAGLIVAEIVAFLWPWQPS